MKSTNSLGYSHFLSRFDEPSLEYYVILTVFTFQLIKKEGGTWSPALKYEIQIEKLRIL